jgi:hypothetical protein
MVYFVALTAKTHLSATRKHAQTWITNTISYSLVQNPSSTTSNYSHPTSYINAVQTASESAMLFWLVTLPTLAILSAEWA